MHDFLKALYADHEIIRDLLEAFEAQLSRLGEGGDPDYGILETGIEYCVGYLDAVHHRKEEQVLDRLWKRDPQAAARIAGLNAQHRELEQAGRAVAATFASVRDGAFAVREELVARGSELLDAYRRHLDWEEEVFFRAADRSLRAEDWERAERRWRDSLDIATEKAAAERFAPLLDAIQNASRASVSVRSRPDHAA